MCGSIWTMVRCTSVPTAVFDTRNERPGKLPKPPPPLLMMKNNNFESLFITIQLSNFRIKLEFNVFRMMKSIVSVIEKELKTHVHIEQGRAFHGWGTCSTSNIEQSPLKMAFTDHADDILALYKSTCLEERIFDDETSQSRVLSLSDNFILTAWNDSLVVLRLEPFKIEIIHSFGEYIQVRIKKVTFNDIL